MLTQDKDKNRKPKSARSAGPIDEAAIKEQAIAAAQKAAKAAAEEIIEDAKKAAAKIIDDAQKGATDTDKGKKDK